MSPPVVTCSAGEARQFSTQVQWKSKQASVVNVSLTTAQAQRQRTRNHVISSTTHLTGAY